MHESLSAASHALCLRLVERTAVALAFLVLFGGCTLPEGKLRGAQAMEEGERARDAGVRQVSSPPVTKSPRSAGTGVLGGAAARSGAGGAVGLDASIPAPPKANGEACNSSADCASANCKNGPKNDKRCYGSIGRGRDCNAAYECDGYACVPRQHGETQGVCIDTSGCTQHSCQQDHALAFCQLDQKCSAAPMDFAKCYEAQCAGDGDADAGCAQTESVVQHLNEIGCCPPAGVSKGSCDTAPQCGCAQDQKCNSIGAGRTACGPIGPASEGGTCAQDVDCPKGFTCRGRLCKRYCSGPDDDSCPYGACVPVKTNGEVEPGIFMCTRRCDPTAPTSTSDQIIGCALGQSCEPYSDGNSDCYATMGTGMQADSCDDGMGDTDGFKCAPGFACMLESKRCEKYCRVQAGKCGSGTCNSFGPSRRYAGSIEIGYCE